MAYEDIVVLVPGFLAFEDVGGFPFFPPEVAATTRAIFEERVRRPVPVVATTNLPTSPLADRQAYLLRSLRRIVDRLGTPQRLHLIGHSTGGVDAQLLTGRRPLLPATSWSALPGSELRPLLHTVVAVCAPFHGTWLADTDTAELLASPQAGSASSLAAAVRAFVPLFGSVTRDLDFPRMAAAVAVDPSGGLRWLRGLFSRWRLASDLSVDHMAQVQAEFEGEFDHVRLRSVAAMAGLRSTDAAGRPDQGDAFFTRLHTFTAGLGGTSSPPSPDPRFDAFVQRLRAPPQIIGSPRVTRAPIDQRTNDGVINTCRQLLDPTQDDELLALVIADHMDVLGHYERGPLYPTEGPPRGILHSASQFRDDQFYALWRTVARAL